MKLHNTSQHVHKHGTALEEKKMHIQISIAGHLLSQKLLAVSLLVSKTAAKGHMPTGQAKESPFYTSDKRKTKAFCQI